MEVCGGHTMAIYKFGLHQFLPGTIRLISGPGCPVCVSSQEFIDKAIALSRISDVIITTYGDLVRVPGTSSSLEKEKAKGADIRMVYSTLESLEIAERNPGKKTIFLGIGFETTAPASAVVVKEAYKKKTGNFFMLSAHKIMPPAMETLVKDGIKVDGFIAPGHVSAITGSSIYTDLAEKHHKSVVISGFEPVDILQSILMLVTQIETTEPKVEIQYCRVVKQQGNLLAQKLMHDVFELSDDEWRGIGWIKNSGLKLRKKFSGFDANEHFPLKKIRSVSPKGCICGEILKGLKNPFDCKLFATTF